MSTILNLALKDLRLLITDKAGLFWFLVFPLVFSLFFGSVMGGGNSGASKLKLSIVDEDQSASSEKIIAQLKKSASLDVSRSERGVAEAAVRKGDQTAMIVIPKGYGENAMFFGGNAKELEVAMDPTRKAEAGFLEGMLMEAVLQGMAERFTDPAQSLKDVQKIRSHLETVPDTDQKKLLFGFFGDFEKYLQKADFKFGSGEAGAGGMMKPNIKKIDLSRDNTGKPKSSFEITFPSGLVWGLYGCVMTFAISLVSERTHGTLLRLRTTPMNWSRILAGKGLACFLACFGITAFLLSIGVMFFGVRVQNPLGLLVALTFGSLGFTGMMLLVSTLGKTEKAVAGAASGIFMPMAMLGGGMIPLFFMPGWLQNLASVSPFKWAILSFEGAIWRDFSFSDYLLPCGMLLAFGLVGFVVGAIIITKSEAV